MTRETKSTRYGPDYVSYLLRLWRDDGGDEIDSQQGPLPWRGSLEKPHTGQRLGFSSLEALFEYLRGETGTGSAAPERDQGSKGTHRPGTWVAALVMCLFALRMTCCVPDAVRYAATQVAPSILASRKSGDVAAVGAMNRPASFQGGEPKGIPGTDGVQVTLTGPHTTVSWDERDPIREKFELPLLFLHQGRAATPTEERTLGISITGLIGGSEIVIEAHSHHADVRTGRPHRSSTHFVLPDRPCTAHDPCTVQWTFAAATTLSDFYTLHVKDRAGNLLWENPYPERPDFVMLDTWDVGVGEYGVPYTVRIIYATLFPFAKGPDDADNRLPPGGVTDFIEGQFVPMILDTWHTQFEAWQFGDPIHPDWDADKVVEIIITDPPFALFGGTGTYAVSIGSDGRPYPERRIWWFSSNGSFQRYDSLENGCRVVFAHEFFHLVQWNVILSAGQASTERAAKRWHSLFIEAQANAASAIQYPEIEIEGDHVTTALSTYAQAANRFLVLRLNTSYRDLESDPVNLYDAALYWRFLYERLNDISVLRAALEEMAYSHNAADIAGSIGTAMDRALARSNGPFDTFEESLVGFARAIYALRLEGGRCASVDLAACEGLLYDPNRMYLLPPLEANSAYFGQRLTFIGAISSSYGMDFFEVRLGPAVHNQTLTIEFKGTGAVARFSVQIWKLGPGRQGVYPRAFTPAPEIIPQAGAGTYRYTIPRVDTMAYDRLALIITRLDPDEIADPVGNYSFTLDPIETISDTVVSSLVQRSKAVWGPDYRPRGL